MRIDGWTDKHTLCVHMYIPYSDDSIEEASNKMSNTAEI